MANTMALLHSDSPSHFLHIENIWFRENSFLLLPEEALGTVEPFHPLFSPKAFLFWTTQFIFLKNGIKTHTYE